MVKTYVDGGKMAEYEKMYAVFVRRGRHGSGAYRAKRRHSAGDRNTSGRAGQSRKHVHRRLMKKSAAQQENGSGFFVVFCCGILRIEELRNNGNKQRKERWKEESNE